MESILIKNGKLVNEGKIWESDVLIKDGIIYKIDSNIKADLGDKIIDAKELIKLNQYAAKWIKGINMNQHESKFIRIKSK